MSVMLLYRFPFSLDKRSMSSCSSFWLKEVSSWKRCTLGGKLTVLINYWNIMDKTRFNFTYIPNGFPCPIYFPFSTPSFLLASASPWRHICPQDGTRLQVAPTMAGQWRLLKLLLVRCHQSNLLKKSLLMLLSVRSIQAKIPVWLFKTKQNSDRNRSKSLLWLMLCTLTPVSYRIDSLLSLEPLPV